ncbi:MAG TPA: ABC transporter permease [Terracidiphilus sp.]|nr:ABC transporter permease [Terracidiphilus sp.]
MHWWQIRKRNADLERELQSDLDLEEEEQRDRGLALDEARYAARRAFGNPALIREQTHQAWGWAPIERLAQDLRYALRQLRAAPGFTVTCVLILALGIGAVTAVFSLIDAALLKMLPVKDPQQLVQLKTISPDIPINDSFSYPAFLQLQQQTRVLSGVLAFRRQHNLDLDVDNQSGLAEGQAVSGSYFSVLGVRAIRGRTILPSDESVAAQNPVAVIGYDYWRSRFALDPNIVGKEILLNNSPYTVVGVTQPEFYGLDPGARIDVSVPLTTYSLINPGYAAAGSPFDVLHAPFRNWLEVMGRLQPGVTRQQAATALEPVFTQIKYELNTSLAGTPGDSPARRQTILGLRLQIDPASQGLATLRQQFSRPLWIVMALTGLLLLITCANVANLLLARANTREKEIALRLAMGAGKARLVRQLFVESLLLGLAGGALGVALAFWGSSSLLTLMAHGRNPVRLSIHPNLAVLAFALAVSLLTAIIFGILPAWRATDVDPSRGLAQSARAVAAPQRHRLGKALVVLQVAISLVLTVGAGLLARSLLNLRGYYPGFNRENVLLLHVDPTVIGIKDVVPIYEQLTARIRLLPGIRVVSLSVHEPLSTNVSDTSVKVQGAAPSQADDQTPVNVEPIGPSYFATMQTPILAGREFSAADRAGAPKVAIVNQATAHHFFGDASPVGRFVSIPGYRADTSWLQIVGLVRDIKVHDLRETSTPMLYVPMWQAPEGGVTFEVRTAIDPDKAVSPVLAAIKSIDARLPVYSIKTLDNQLDDSLVQERLVASLSDLFGLLALVLTCVGLYGLLAYTVNRRAGEIGIRMALGAERARVARMILRETLLLVACGLALGLPAAILASRLIATQLFGLKPSDPITISAACAVMALVAIAAAYLPARRAASIDPMRALRTE